jgi:hypothetical protein
MQSSNKSKQHELLQRQLKEQYKDQANLNNDLFDHCIVFLTVYVEVRVA